MGFVLLSIYFGPVCVRSFDFHNSSRKESKSNRRHPPVEVGSVGQVGKASCSTQVRATTVNAVVHDVTAPMDMVR